MDIIDIVLSKKYTDESLKGITGTLAGKNCTIKSATKTDGVTTVVFAWTADDGTEETTTIQVNDGVDGKDTSQEAVLFIEQKLDDAQRTQARENIGAADAARQNILTGSEIGNPIVVDDAFSAPLSGLTLYGKSTQRSTTGAQLCDFRNIKTSGSGDIIITFNKDGIGIVKGTPVNEAYAFTILGKPVDLSLLEIGETYTSNESIRYAKKDNPGKYFYSRSIMFTEDIARIDVYAQRSIQDYKNGEILSPMLNKGNTVLAFEPYTGGAPSPSPSYPQEIENAGQSREIGVQVYGGNLFDIRKASPWEDAYGLQMSLDGEYITVKGVTTTTRYGNISFRILGYPVNLYGNRFSLDIVKNVGTSKEYVYTSATENTLALSVVVDAKAAVELKFRLMVNAGSTALPYEPYKPAQTLIIPTPNGLPGIPVSSGGNYTDADGQQWVCDEVDLKRGVYVQNVAFAEFGKGITVLKKNNAVSNENFVAAYFFTSPSKRIKTRQTILSNCLSYVETVNKVNKPYSISNEFDTEAMYVTIPTELYENDVQMLNLLAEKKIKILYATYPTERPLSTEELEKYRSLRTYSPTTTVINDAGAGSQLDYQRDVNISIKKLEDAIASMTTT